MESVPSYHHYKTTENIPVDKKAFMTAVNKEVYNGCVTVQFRVILAVSLHRVIFRCMT